MIKFLWCIVDYKKMKQFIFKLLTFIICLFLSFSGTVLAQDILKIDSVHFDNSDKLIFLSATAPDGGQRDIKTYNLKQPNRVYFDLENSVLIGEKRNYVLEKSPIKEIVISQNSVSPSVVRVVLTLDEDTSNSDIKVSQINGNILINYGKLDINGDYFSTIFRDFRKSSNDYYEYSKIYSQTVERNTIPIMKPDADKKVLEEIQSSIKNTTLNNSDGLNYDTVKKTNIDTDLKTGYYLKLVKYQNNGILVQGVGHAQIENPTFLSNPSRMVIDMPNSYVEPSIRNKEIPLGDSGETVKVGQFEVNKARVVITTNQTAKYLPIFSPDNQSIFIINTDKLNSAYVSQTKTNINGYFNKKIDRYTNEFTLAFTKPVIIGIRRNPDSFTAYFLNAVSYNEQEFKQALEQAGLKDIKLSLMSNIGIRMTCPLSRDKVIRFDQNINGKAVKIVVTSPTPAPLIQRNKKVKGSVVIDPGHGGTDYGAIRAGINEKDITLDVSKMVEAILQEKGYKVYMTRNDDSSVSLQERVEFSEKKKPDIYVSIHVNSSVKNDIYGVETHWYNDYSHELAEVVHKHLVKNIPSTKDRGLFKSKFYVINHTTVPAILVEMGFISNDAERAQLVTEKRKQIVAKSIAEGIIEYISSKK